MSGIRQIFVNIWGSDVGSSVAPSGSKIDLGFIEERPPFQWWNWAINKLFNQADHVSKNGIPEWISTETYPVGGLCLLGGIIYKSLQNTNLNKNPLLEPTWWTLYMPIFYKHRITGFVPSSGSTPDEQVNMGSGQAICENGTTIIELASDEADIDYPTLNGGALAVDTTYHLFRFLKDDDTMQWHLDISLTPTIANIKSVKAYRRVLSLDTDSSGDLYGFNGQLLGNGTIKIKLATALNILSTGSPSGTLADLDTKTPSGLKLDVEIGGVPSLSSGNSILSIKDKLGSASKRLCTLDTGVSTSGVATITSNISSLIQYLAGGTGTYTNLEMTTISYTDYRNYF